MVVTGNRAEYGLLKNLIKKIELSDKLDLQLVVTGSHLVERFGYTIDEIINDGFKITAEVDMLIESTKKSAINKSMGLQMIQFSTILERLEPDIIVILGDRYEMLTVAVSATMMNIPIAHIAGGEISYGANDEQIRHAITKMAHLHFAEADIYATNIKNMGEEAWRVHSVGALGIENIATTQFLDIEELNKTMGVKIDDNTILMTYHPTTLESESLKYEIDELLLAISHFKNLFIITYPNADNGGSYIISRLKEFAEQYDNIKLFESLGVQRYLSVMKHCKMVIGNSSSALIEAPYLKKPVVNIGNRQEGRLMADNIISCSNKFIDIIRAINQAKSEDFLRKVADTKSLYGDGDTSSDIIKVLEEVKINSKLMRKKLEWSEKI